MRTLTAKQLLEASGRSVTTHARVFVDITGAGGFQDLSNHLGQDWVKSVEVTDSVDQPTAAASILLRRSVFGQNLSPLVQQAEANQRPLGTYLPAITVTRAVRVEACALPPDTAPLATDWLNIFEGSVADLDVGASDSTLKLSCVDKGGLLIDTFIETQRVYGSAFPGTPVETVIQGILNDNINTPGLGSVTLYTPVSPSFNIVPYIQQKETVFEAIRKLAQQIGWECKYRWDSGTSSWRLTLYSPDRAKVVPDWTFDRDDISGPSQLRISAVNIRNRIRVVYTNKSVTPNVRTSIIVDDVPSQTKYRLRYMEAAEDAAGQIDTPAEGSTFANAMLADLKEPFAEFATDQKSWLPAETGDLYRFSADPEIYDAAQDLAVVSWRHRFTENESRSSFTLRGRPSGGFTKWLRLESRTGIAPTSDFDSTGTPIATTQPTIGGVIITYDDPQALSPPVTDWRTSECHVDGPYDSPPGGDFTPSSATLKEIGRTTRFEITNLVPGKYYRIKVIVIDLRGNAHPATSVLTQASVLVGPYNTNLTTEQGNLLPNADFEVTTLPNNFVTTPPDNWQVGFNNGATDVLDPTKWNPAGPIYRDTTPGNNESGAVSILFSPTAVLFPHIVTKSLPLTADKPYRFMVALMADNAAKATIVAVRSYDSTGVQVGLTLRSGVLPVAPGTWHHENVTFRTPATARAFKAFVYNQQSTPGNLWCDKFEFFKAMPFFFQSWTSNYLCNSGVYTPMAVGGAFPGPTDIIGGAVFNLSQFTAREAGSYDFCACLQLLVIPVNTIMRLALFKNGAEFQRGPEVKQSANNTPLTASLAVSAMRLTTNDVVDCRVYHNSGAAKATTTNWRQSYFSGVRTE